MEPNELQEILLKLPAREVMALNANFEAAAEYSRFGVESLVGPMAVVLNRWRHPSRWQESIQEVVAARRQFSWTNWDAKIKDPQYPRALKFARRLLAGLEVDNVIYHVALDLTGAMLGGQAANPVANATFYYNPGICCPSWAANMIETKVIGHHRFMADPGDPEVLWDRRVNYFEDPLS